MKANLKIYTDGGSRGNPGPSAAAWVVFEGDVVIGSGSHFLGIGTNNNAEYKGVILALEWLTEHGELIGEKTLFFLDSELVVKQLTGVYKIKDLKLGKLVENIRFLESNLNSEIEYTAVPRSKNKIADGLVNEALDKALQK